jgi:transcriptional regulatory protein LevR/transcriptional regulator with AAA-type ATPase domain
MRKQRVLETLFRIAPPGAERGATTEEVARAAGILRQNASADLNQLCREGLVRKSSGRPVKYWATEVAQTVLGNANKSEQRERPTDIFAEFIGANGSLRMAVEQAKAAMVYPPRGLPTLIVGPTGVGKSHLAEMMYRYAVQSGRLRPDAPFHVFNCADYAANPQLLLAQLFGYVKGSFTGANETTPGLIAQTDNGVLFLDEIHRLPPEGQEMLFLLMDRGEYRMLGAGAASRKASVTLIAATSENPQSVLLTTLLRRFPVVIQLPELHARPLEERLALVEFFLREEATRIGLSISVSPLVLVALLTFRAVGNVGELRSAILLGCAKAFLNYMASGNQSGVMPLYLTHLAPEIQLDYLRNHLATMKAEQLVGVEERIYLPAYDRGVKQHFPEGMALDLYSDLQKRMNGYLDSNLRPEDINKLIRIDLDYYLRRLRGNKNGNSSVPAHFLEVVADFVEEAGRELGHSFGPETITALALHLASASRSGVEDNNRTLALAAYCAREYGVVQRLVPKLESGLGITLSSGEIGFLALFLATHHRKTEPSGITVLVLCHGTRTASSMAEVANQLLGEQRVIAVDMPLTQSVDETLQLTIRRIKESGKTKGILLLVDMGSLTGFGRTIERATGIPVAVLPLVTTAAVIEAGRLAGRGDVDLPNLVHAVKQVYNHDAAMLLSEQGKRVIITTCLTGQGTARKLAAFLTEALPTELRDEIVVQPVDVENGSEIPGLLVEGWRGTVIAAVGTVDPRLPGVTFIGMEQILFGEGVQTLVALAMNGQRTDETPESLTKEEAIALASRFVEESIVEGDGQTFAEAATEALARLEELSSRRVTPSQAVRWVIHFAFAMERLISEGSVLECNELPYLQEHHPNLVKAVKQATSPVEEEFGVQFSDGEIGYLALIVLTE